MKVPQNFHAIQEVIFHFPIALLCSLVLFFYLSSEVRKSRTDFTLKVVSLVYCHVFPSSVAMTANAESH